MQDIVSYFLYGRVYVTPWTIVRNWRNIRLDKEKKKKVFFALRVSIISSWIFEGLD